MTNGHQRRAKPTRVCVWGWAPGPGGGAAGAGGSRTFATTSALCRPQGPGRVRKQRSGRPQRKSVSGGLDGRAEQGEAAGASDTPTWMSRWPPKHSALKFLGPREQSAQHRAGVGDAWDCRALGWLSLGFHMSPWHPGVGHHHPVLLMGKPRPREGSAGWWGVGPGFQGAWFGGGGSGAHDLGCCVPRVPPHRDGVTPHRGQPDQGLLHAAPWPGGPARPAQHAGVCWGGPVSCWVGGSPVRSAACAPDRLVPLKTTTTTGHGVPRTRLRPSGSRWTREGPPSSQASSPRAATPVSST